MSAQPQPELLHLSLDLWHPDCWALQVTEDVDADLFGHGALTDGTVARERYVISGDSEDELNQLVETVQDSPLTCNVVERDNSVDGPAIGTCTREIFVEFYAPNSIDSAFVSRGFVYDDLPQMTNGRETWSLLVHATRDDVGRVLDTIRDERNADITLNRIVAVRAPSQHSFDERERLLCPRQREALALVPPQGFDVYDRLTRRHHLEFIIDSNEADDDPDMIAERVGGNTLYCNDTFCHSCQTMT